MTQGTTEKINFAIEAISDQNIIFMNCSDISNLAFTRYKASFTNTTYITVGWKEIVPAQRRNRV